MSDDYDPNTRHCQYGADADLIMLGLSTHEPFFYIIRESLTTGWHYKNNKNKYHFNKQKSNWKNKKEDFSGFFPEGGNDWNDDALDQIIAKTRADRRFRVDFNFVRIFVLREFLHKYTLEIQESLEFEYNLDSVCDDFVFMCFLAGNDFLPHQPALNIKNGGIEVQLHLYKSILPELGGYLTFEGEINMKRMDIFLQGFAAAEKQILKQLEDNQIEYSKRNVNARIELPGRLHDLLDDDIRELVKKDDGDNGDTNHKQKNEVKEISDTPNNFNKPYQPKTNTNDLGGGYNTTQFNSLEIANFTKANDKNNNKSNFNVNAMTNLWGPSDSSNTNTNNSKTGQQNNNENSGQNNKDVASKQREEQFTSMSGRTTQLIQADPNKDPINVWAPNSNMEKHVNDEKCRLEKKKSDFKIMEPVAKAEFEKKFKDELKQVCAFEESKKMRMTESIYFQENLNYKMCYYKTKFEVDPQDYEQMVKNTKEYFIEGLAWNLAYYYKGCISWEWFCPYFYAPFASDLTNLNEPREFAEGKPFEAIQQLMAVLPPHSCHAVPEQYREQMQSDESELVDFYPRDFYVDLRGKGVSWLGEVIQPLIDEERLIKASKKLEHTLSENELYRNRLGKAVYFTNDPDSKGYLTGTFSKADLRQFVNDKDLLNSKEVMKNISCCLYELPELKRHRCFFLPNAITPEDELDARVFIFCLNFFRKLEMRGGQGLLKPV